MSLFCCPHCALPLRREANEYHCSSGHRFDVAREGYVHLLPANRKHSANPGDDREMVMARARFLEKGWYAPLRDALCHLALTHTPPGGVVVDAGCGEGWYSQGLWNCLTKADLHPRLVGVDLSRAAVKKAARRVTEGEFAIASVYRLPLADGCAHLLLDCFAPLALAEYRRVLRPGGIFLYVVPGPRHLFELKTVLYDRPYENRVEQDTYPGLTLRDMVAVDFSMDIRDRQTLLDLFRMTPYAWKTPREGVERLEALDGLAVTASFQILVLKVT